MTAYIARTLALASLLFAGAAHSGFDFPTHPPLATPDLDVWSSGTISVAVRDASGGVIIGGGFQQVNGVPRRGLARLLPDGTLDPDFAPNPDSGVFDVAIASDGTIYVTGSFGTIGGQAHARVARMSATGAVDAGWTPSLDVSASTISLGDDELYLGGFFNTVNGQPRPRLARVLLAGSGALDTAWAPTASNPVEELAWDITDDSLFLAGDFLSINSTPRGRIAKIDGSGSGALRTWDAPASNRVEAIELDGLGNLYVAGDFTVIGANGASRNHLARLSTTTGDADALSLDFLQGTDGDVNAMDLQGGFLYLGGSFTHVNGTPRAYAAKVSIADGSLDNVFAPVLDRGIHEVFAPGNGAVYLSGGETRYVNGDTRLGIAPVNTITGATLAPVDIVIPGVVYTMLALPGGGQIIGGEFYRIEDAPRENLAKLRADGTVDPDWAPTVDHRVRVMALDANAGMLYVGGVFDEANDAPRNAVAKFAVAGTGALQPWDAQIVERAGLEPVRALAVDASGDVYVGGFFQEIDGQARSFLAKLSGDDATLDATWGSGANATVSSLAVAPDGSVYASGFFNQINGQNRGRLAKLDPVTGVVDLAFTAELPASETVYTWTFDGNDLYIGGSFTSVGGTPRGHVARIDAATGAVDASWAPNVSGDVYAVLPSGDAVFLAGEFSSIGGTLRFQVAKVSAADGALDTTWDPQVYDGPLLAAVLDPDGNLVIAGAFRNIGTTPRQGLAAIAPSVVVVLPPHIFGNGFEG